MDDGNYQSFFKLQENEEIIFAIKPLSGLKWMLLSQNFIIVGFITLFFGIWIIMPLLAFSERVGGILLLGIATFIILLLVFFVVPYIFASLEYNKRFYWITNKRVIEKTGLIGYKINSIPFERISDIIISRSFLEKIFGIGSIHIQSLAGQISYSGRFGAEGNLQAVPDPEGLQEKIFSLIKEKRNKENLTI